MKNDRPVSTSDQGAVLIHVAMVLIALTAFSSFVVDFGVLWASRRQAQNVADSAALSGAVSFMLDSMDDTSTTGPAAQAAAAMVEAGRVWGETPIADITLGATACPGNMVFDLECVRVDVHRTAARGNPLPVFFASLMGLASQDVRATATARSAPGNASDCMMPWGLTDRWDLSGGTTYETGDIYMPQNGINLSGTSYSVATHHGTQMTLTTSASGPITPGWYQPLDLDGAGGGYTQHQLDISGCAGVRLKVGDDIPTDTGGWTPDSGVAALIALDPGAYWDPSLLGGRGGVAGSCANTTSCPGGATYKVSPRLVSIPVFHLSQFVTAGGPNAAPTIRVASMVGFFVEALVGSSVQGRLALKPDLFLNDGGTIAGASGFVRHIQLIR